MGYFHANYFHANYFNANFWNTTLEIPEPEPEPEPAEVLRGHGGFQKRVYKDSDEDEEIMLLVHTFIGILN